MKKTAYILGTILLLAVTNLSAQKERYPYPNERGDTLYFAIYDSTAEIISEQKAFITDTLFIPQKISYMGVDYTVTQIHSRAFIGIKFNHVVIPEGITYIGSETFANNDSLRTITFPASFNGTLLSNMFGGCKKLKWADFSMCHSEVLLIYALQLAPSLQWVKLPPTLKYASGIDVSGDSSLKFVLFPPSMDSMFCSPYQNIGMNIPIIFTTFNKMIQPKTYRRIKGQKIPIYYQYELDSSYKNDSFWNDSSYYILHPSHFLKDGYMDLDSICPWEAERLYGFHPDTVGVYIVEKHNPNDGDSFNIYFVNSILNPGEIYDTTIDIEPNKEDTSVLWTWEGTAFAYNVYRDGSYITTVEQPSFLDTNIEYNVQYCYNFAPVNEKYCEGKWSTTNCYTMLSDTTGVAEHAAAHSLVIYPNPAKNVLFISANEPTNVNGHINGTSYEITDVTGRMVLQGSYNATEGIHVGNLAKGVYLLRMEGKVGKFGKN